MILVVDRLMSSVDERYARYGLGGNPFRTISDDSIDHVSRVHANLSVDDTLGDLKEDVFFRRGSHSVLLVGDQGMGKSHRVMVAHAEAMRNNLFSRCISFSRRNRPAMYQFVKAFLPKGSALFSNDKWQRELAKLKKDTKKSSYDPRLVAGSVADALNRNTPSFVLIDDLDTVQVLPDNQSFLQFLFELTRLLQPGVFLLVSASSSFASWLLKQFPQVRNLFHVQVLQPLTDDEAVKMVGKWLESYRLVDGLHPLFPFSTSSVHLLNSQSHGNPKSVLDLSDLSLTAASYQKAVVITDMIVKEALLTVKEQRPAVLKEKQMSAEVTPELQHFLRTESESKMVEHGRPEPVLPNQVVHAEEIEETQDEPSSDLQRPIEQKGGNEEQIRDGQHDDLVSPSPSETPLNGIKDVSAVTPLAPQQLSVGSDDLTDVVQTLDHEDAELTRMKPVHEAVVTPVSGDNGNKKNQEEPASIMHQAKRAREVARPAVEADEDDTVEELEEINEVSEIVDEDALDVWEPVQDDEGAVAEREPVESVEAQKEKQVGSSDEGEGFNADSIDEDVDESESEVKAETIEPDQSPEPESVVTPVLPTPVTNDDVEQIMDDESETLDNDLVNEEAESLDEHVIESESSSDDLGHTTQIKEEQKKTHAVKQPHIQVTSHNHETAESATTSSAKRVLRIRCPECSKDFTIELDEHTHSLTCPFCGFYGEL